MQNFFNKLRSDLGLNEICFQWKSCPNAEKNLLKLSISNILMYIILGSVFLSVVASCLGLYVYYVAKKHQDSIVDNYFDTIQANMNGANTSSVHIAETFEKLLGGDGTTQGTLNNAILLRWFSKH